MPSSPRQPTPICALLFLSGLLLSPPEAAAQGPSSEKPRFEEMGRSAGVRRYAPGEWGVVSARLVNPTANSVNLRATTYFEGESNIQYARDVWMPPHSRRSVTYPVRMPSKTDETKRLETADVKSMLFDRTGSKEELLKPVSGQILHTERLIADDSNVITGIIPPDAQEYVPGEYHAEIGVDFAMESVVAWRLGARHSRQIVTLRDDALPSTPEALDALDQLVIANNRIGNDSVAMSAVRKWVLRGGRLWLPLNSVSEETVNRLFGDALSIQLVDRVGLNEFEIREPAPAAPNPTQRSTEEAIDFLRVIPTGVDVAHEINGWPASFWLKYGRGLVLFTTLAPEGWVRPRTERDPRPREAELFSLLLPTDPFSKLGERFFERPAPPAVGAELLAQVASEQVGYKIVGRRTVLATLSLFCIGLIAAGVWLMKKERMETLGWLGPIGALVTAVVLVGLGTAARQAVPRTVAEVQLIDVPSGTQEVAVSGLAAIYTPEPSAVVVGSNAGGIVFPESGGSSERRVMNWTDIDKWIWEGLSIPAGVSAVRLDAVVPLKDRIQLRGTFGPEGFTGKLSAGPLRNFEDALIVTSLNRRVATTIDADGNVTARTGDVLARSEYLATTFLNDEQQRRLSILRQMLAPGGKFANYSSPSALLAWTTPIDAHFVYPEDSQRAGSALAALPVEIERPSPGSTIAIPSLFLTCRDVDGPKALPGSRNAYNFRDGAWADNPKAACTWLRFELPREVLPMKLSSAELRLQVSAPSRALEIEGLSGSSEVVPLAKETNPMGTFSFTINNPDVLEIDPQGGITFGLNVTDLSTTAADPRQSGGSETIWKFEYVDLEVRGQTAAP